MGVTASTGVLVHIDSCISSKSMSTLSGCKYMLLSIIKQQQNYPDVLALP